MNNTFFWPVHIEDNIGRLEQDVIAPHICKNIVVCPPPELSSNNRYVVHSASKEYGLLPNADFFPVFEQVLNDHNVQFQVKYNASPCKSRFIADYDILSEKFSLEGSRVSDELIVMFRITNSYNGRLSFSLNMGVKRLICSNGLIGLFEEKAIEFKHTTKNMSELSDRVYSLMNKLLNSESKTNLIEFCENLSNQRLDSSWDQYLSDLLKDSSIPKSVEEGAILRLQQEIRSGFDVTKWTVLNAVQYSLWNTLTKASFERKITLERNLFKNA